MGKLQLVWTIYSIDTSPAMTGNETRFLDRPARSPLYDSAPKDPSPANSSGNAVSPSPLKRFYFQMSAYWQWLAQFVSVLSFDRLPVDGHEQGNILYPPLRPPSLYMLQKQRFFFFWFHCLLTCVSTRKILFQVDIIVTSAGGKTRVRRMTHRKNCHHPPRTRLSKWWVSGGCKEFYRQLTDSHPSFTPGQGWQTCRYNTLTWTNSQPYTNILV